MRIKCKVLKYHKNPHGVERFADDEYEVKSSDFRALKALGFVTDEIPRPTPKKKKAPTAHKGSLHQMKKVENKPEPEPEAKPEPEKVQETPPAETKPEEPQTTEENPQPRSRYYKRRDMRSDDD